MPAMRQHCAAVELWSSFEAVQLRSRLARCWLFEVSSCQTKGPRKKTACPDSVARAKASNMRWSYDC